MEPAYSIVLQLGGVVAVSKVVGLTPSAISQWSAPPPGGCGGLVPARHIPKLCAFAELKGIELEPNSFFAGHMRKKKSRK
jgi:hypothetical protein